MIYMSNGVKAGKATFGVGYFEFTKFCTISSAIVTAPLKQAFKRNWRVEYSVLRINHNKLPLKLKKLEPLIYTPANFSYNILY